MPSAKLPFFRYLLIDQMLRSKGRTFPSKEELLEACRDKFGVSSISTIEKDLNAMRLDFDAPIVYNRFKGGYEYSDKGYKFLSVNLSSQNMLALGFVESILEEFKCLPIFEEFSDAVDRLLDGLEITKTLGKNQRKLGKFIQIDKSPYYKGSELLGELIGAIANEQVLEIKYKKFGAEHAKPVIMHPYMLKEYRNMWYILGYVEQYERVIVFALDRIEQMSILNKAYFKPEKAYFNAETFFADTVGVTVSKNPPEKVLLLFSTLQGKYIEAQPIHRSQQIIENTEKGCLVELEVVINPELKMQILSYGANVEVLAPPSFVEEIGKEIKKMQFIYDKSAT